MPDNFCVECNKEFRSQSGLNGHNQWKHNKLTEKPLAYTVTGRAVEMFERVGKQLDAIRDEQENLKDMILSIQRNGVPVGIRHVQGNGPAVPVDLGQGNGQGNGPGNDQGNGLPPGQGNDQGFQARLNNLMYPPNATTPAPAPAPKPKSEDELFQCSMCGAMLPAEVPYCSGCGEKLTWKKGR